MIGMTKGTYALNRCLQETSRLQPRPNLQHREISTPNHRRAALGPELSKNGESAVIILISLFQYKRAQEDLPSKQIQPGIQFPANPLQQQNTQYNIYKIAFQPDVVRSHHTQHFIQHIPNLNIP
jgi:hypothetical protein